MRRTLRNAAVFSVLMTAGGAVHSAAGQTSCPCDGGVTFLSLRFDGPSGTRITVDDKGTIIFDAVLATGDTFDLYGTRLNGRFQSNNLVFSAGGTDTTIHVSCSQPIDVGMVFGPFTIENFASRLGGACQPLQCADGSEPVADDSSDLSHDSQGDLCVASLRPVTRAGSPASFVITARTRIDSSAPTDPDASGQVGHVVTAHDGAGVKRTTCEGSKGISGQGSDKDEELVFTFDAPIDGRCVTLSLSEFDDDDGSSSSGSNGLVTAEAGQDQATLPGFAVTLDGSASTGPPGAVLLYRWTQIAGPPVSLSNPTALRPGFQAPTVSQPTSLQFTLEVSAGLAVAEDSIMVTVNPPVPGNSFPVVSAGPNQVVEALTPVLLDAGQTVDVDGDPLTFQWTQVSGPPAAIFDANTPRARFLSPDLAQAATLVFRVIVSDGAAVVTSTSSVESSSSTDEPVIFISTTGSPGYDITVTTAEIKSVLTRTGDEHANVSFADFAALSPGLTIDAFKIRETRGHIFVDFIDFFCPCTTDADCADGNACNGNETCDAVCGCLPGVPIGCDDLNPCNGVETCDPAVGCVAGTPTPGASCDDGDLCNGDDICDGSGNCVSGPPPACDDGNPCNGAESCDPTLGCLAGTPTPGASCDDGDPCTVNDTCTSFDCEGTPKDCSAFNDQCHIGVCDGMTGLCEAVATPGVACDDGNACTSADTCDAMGVCAGATVDCSNGDVCDGLETCDPATGCQSGTPLVCDDNDVCNGLETCDPSNGCQAGTPLVCNDGNVCNGLETCDPSNGCQAGTPLVCDDNNVCNGAESCNPATGCTTGMPLNCDDGVGCTIDSCDPLAGCGHSPDDSACDDGNACTGIETCDVLLDCRPGTPVNCDDGLFCTGTETCDPATGQCSSSGNPCTASTKCSEALDMCVDCLVDAQCIDNTVCNGGETCDMLGQCQPGTPLVCDDNNACNGLETCDPVAGCQAGTPPVCSDNDVCNGIETCDPATGCVAGTPLVCDDGLFCNGLETCDSLLGCLPGTPPTLGDGVVCTDDTCDEVNDVVVHTPNDANCDDTLFCNGAETCDLLLDCQVGTPPTLDDGVGCTDDSCDEVNDVVVHVPNDANCGDMNPCTDDTCDPVTDCVFTPDDTNNCELDGDLCTIDTCVAGVCNTDNVICPPDEDCATFNCNPTNGMCLASAINEGLPCTDDGNECTQDFCMMAVCEHPDVTDGTACADDGNECSDDICLAGMCEHPDIADGIACTSDMIECTLDACLAGFCDHDPMNAFCDDALFCTGTETCDPPIGDPVTGCFTTGEPCDMSSESCCEDVDVCAQCCVDSQCDDFDNCTTDSCDAGTCRFDPVVCPDDGLFCTGVESCNPATGQCVSSGPPCLGPAGVCCDATDTCVAECCSDTDCVDSDGCTGEVCSSGLCFHPPVCGACCVSDPVPACSDGITSRDCASLGGDFKLGEVCVGDANGNGVDETCETVIPTVSQWGLIVLTLLLLAGAKIRFGRRRATA